MSITCWWWRCGNRLASPTAGVIDSQSVNTTESGGPTGFDAGKKIRGRKRHIVTHTEGNLVGLHVHTADIHYPDGASATLKSIRSLCPWLRHVFADGGYAGGKLRDAMAPLACGPSRSSGGPTTQWASNFYRDVGSSKRLLLGSVAADDWQKILRPESRARLHGSSSRTSDAYKATGPSLTVMAF